jgi:hypothetical protein
MFKDMVRRVNSRRGGVRMSYSGSSGSRRPRSLPQIIEEAPIRERTCQECGNRYAVFGEHVACPTCGPLPALIIAEDALAAQECVLDVLLQLPVEIRDELREAGALERTAAGILGSAVSIIETFLKRTFLDRVAGGDAIIAKKGTIFQRLDDAAKLYRDHMGIDLPAALGTPEWDRLFVLYGIRHLLTHTNGVVDQKYVTRFPRQGFVVGQRVSATLDDAREVLHLAGRLVAQLP